MHFSQSLFTNMFRAVLRPSSVWRSYYSNTVVVNCITVTPQQPKLYIYKSVTVNPHGDTINHSFTLAIRTSHWRCPKYCPKHVGEDIANKIRNKF